ncbi:hypothetical protein GCM10027047_03500 [Rhodococcus aerolatus]
MTTTAPRPRTRPLARRSPARRRPVPPMPRRGAAVPAPPALHVLHGPWTLTVVEAAPDAPPITPTTW